MNVDFENVLFIKALIFAVSVLMRIHIYLLYKLTSYEVSIPFSQQILKLGFKIRSFSKCTFAGLFKNVIETRFLILNEKYIKTAISRPVGQKSKF